MLALSNRQQLLLEYYFSDDLLVCAKQKLETKAGQSIPFCQSSTPPQLDRIRFAIIKQSQGCISKLDYFIQLAHSDWRMLLAGAGFAEDPSIHNQWFAQELGIIAWWHA